MPDTILRVAVTLAYGPFLVMALLYLVAAGIRLAGRADFLRMLVRRTSIPEPVHRNSKDEEEW